VARCEAPSHTSLVVPQFLAEKSIPVITQPPYSPDLAPSDFWMFPTLKMGLKGAHFATMEDIKWNATTDLQKIPKEAYRRCFQQRQDRWSKCVCVCVCARVLLWRWLGKRCHVSNRRALRISLRVTFGCSLLWKWTSRGRISQPWRTSNGMLRPNCRRFQKKSSAGASNNGRIDRASVCVRRGPTFKVIR